MPTIDAKSLIIGLALGYFILPRVTSFVTGKVAEVRNADK